MTTRLLILGARGGTNVGDSLLHAARELGVEASLVETSLAMVGPAAWRHVSWRLLGRRPPALRAYNRALLDRVREFRPTLCLSTGMSPVLAETLATIRAGGAASANFSTDDPWNPAHASRRYLRAVPEYDAIFTPRAANVADFRAAGARRVERLPFAYDPRHCGDGRYAPTPEGPDVMFVGGADRDRLRLLRPLLGTGLSVALHGDYWRRDAASRPLARGYLLPSELARATTAAKLCLGVVRRANRDGHVMRSYEIAASGGCVLAEDTRDHRELFADAAGYFVTPQELAERAVELCADPARRAALAHAARERVVGGANTYRDRLRAILASVAPPW